MIEKDYEKMIQEICQEGAFTSIVVTQIGDDRRVEASVLAEVFRKYTKAPVIAKDQVKEAFETALEKKGEGMLFCAGSLYLVGEIKAVISEQKVQKH